jgi:uncharacterized protein (TIGR02145 family)
MNYRFFLLLFLISTISFSCSIFKQNNYKIISDKPDTVKIGNQVWMTKNLDVDHYLNGDSIPEVRDPEEWGSLKTGAWCYYDNDSDNGEDFGKLYNWYAVNDPRVLAPKGWHVPTHLEWVTLIDSLSIEFGGYKYGEFGTIKFNKFKPDSIKVGEFYALPGGFRNENGMFWLIEDEADWWSSSAFSPNHSSYIGLNSGEPYEGVERITTGLNYNVNGLSVRCVKNTNLYSVPNITNIYPNPTFIGGEVVISGSGFGSLQDTNFVTFNNLKFTEEFRFVSNEIKATQYSFWTDNEIKVKVPINATNGIVSVTIKGTKSNEVEYLIYNPCTDITIGTQIWMCKNLDVDHYRSGDSIPEIRDFNEWAKQTTGAWCYYNNDPEIGKIYGKLYNWYAINDPRGLAPSGYHIASNPECEKLINYLGGNDEAGCKMKDLGIFHWLITYPFETNESGFTAMPGGYRINSNGLFLGNGTNATFWSSEYDSDNAWCLLLRYGYRKAYIEYYPKEFGMSVRCIKDN